MAPRAAGKRTSPNLTRCWNYKSHKKINKKWQTETLDLLKQWNKWSPRNSSDTQKKQIDGLSHDKIFLSKKIYSLMHQTTICHSGLEIVPYWIPLRVSRKRVANLGPFSIVGMWRVRSPYVTRLTGQTTHAVPAPNTSWTRFSSRAVTSSAIVTGRSDTYSSF